jgi:uncharacterized membrane protein YdjX (TVP38/TMEM64 family)
LRHFDYELPDFDEEGKSALRFTLLMKLTPVLPGFAKNYGLAVAGVPFSVYFVTSMLITGLFATAWILIGESLLEHRFDRTVLLGAAAVLLLTVAVLWWRKRAAGVTGDAA